MVSMGFSFTHIAALIFSFFYFLKRVITVELSCHLKIVNTVVLLFRHCLSNLQSKFMHRLYCKNSEYTVFPFKKYHLFQRIKIYRWTIEAQNKKGILPVKQQKKIKKENVDML